MKTLLITIILIHFLLLIYIITIDKLGFTLGNFKDSFIKLPNGYRYHCISEHNCKITLERYSSEEAFLPEKIFELAYDEMYAIAKQYGMSLKYPNNPNNSYKIPNKDEIYYWILDTKEKIRYGPYSDIKELKMKEFDLNISDLEFKSVNSYKKSYK